MPPAARRRRGSGSLRAVRALAVGVGASVLGTGFVGCASDAPVATYSATPIRSAPQLPAPSRRFVAQRPVVVPAPRSGST